MQCARRRFSLISFEVTKRRAALALALALALAWLVLARPAAANPRIFPFTYTADTLPKGDLELEAYTDYIPIRVASAIGRNVWYGSTAFQTELEYGITSKLELGLYVTFAPAASQDYNGVATPVEGNGLKQRLKYRLAGPGQWPIDVAVYGELVEDHRELEIEAKLILERRLGPLRIAANSTVEREYYFTSEKDWVLNESAGVTVEITPAFQPGLEAFVRAEYTSPKITPRPFNLGPHLYVGPTVLSQFGRLWWTVGAYARLTDHSRSQQVGDTYGNYWLRSVVGYDL